MELRRATSKPFSLLRSGLRLEAQEKFRKLFQEAFAKGFLPPTDNDFRTAFVDGTNVAEWVTLMDTAARDGIAAKRRPLVVLLARQCRLGSAISRLPTSCSDWP